LAVCEYEFLLFQSIVSLSDELSRKMPMNSNKIYRNGQIITLNLRMNCREINVLSNTNSEFIAMVADKLRIENRAEESMKIL
jgi:hypothetical protein